MKRFTLRVLLAVLFPLFSVAQPAGYYDPAASLTGTALQQALHDIIDGHTPISYTSIWSAFYTTDDKPNNTVWDMYSDIPNGTPNGNPVFIYTFGAPYQGATVSAEGQGYNREHSFPKSWFGGEVAPMFTDMFHVIPTDCYVNTRRSNYPYGKVDAPTYTSNNGSKLGPCTVSGYSGIVFEPIDEYKGDLARNFFYMATRYFGEDASWPGSDMVTGSQPKPWALAMLMQWHMQDPVSQKEIDRNNTIYGSFQGNRNPFIDNPDFAALIWPQYATPKTEPANHVTNFASAVHQPPYSAIRLTWTASAGSPTPDGYLIKGSTTGLSSIVAPVDGVTESNDFLVKNVGASSLSAIFNDLNPSSVYYFKIYPYTNGGSLIDYKTDGTVPGTQIITAAPPCIFEQFTAATLPAGWVSNGVNFTTAPGKADFNSHNGTLSTISLQYPNALTFDLSRSDNAVDKTFYVEVSTTSQSSGFVTLQTYTHANTISNGTTVCNVDLSNYSSYAQVYIQFRKASATTSYWRLDNVVISCGATTTWNGLISSNWENTGNWNNGVPVSGMEVKIAAAANQPIINEDISLSSLTILSLASLKINPGKSLTVTGSLINSAGASGLELLSDATGTASLMHNTTDVIAQVNQYISGVSSWPASEDGWHFISSPVKNQSIANGFVPLVDEYDMFAWDEPAYQWLNQKVAANAISSFGSGQGYLLAYQNSGIRTFEGLLHQGNINLNITKSAYEGSGWNLIGNPFPSAIDWDLVDKTNIESAIYIRNSANNGWCTYVDGIGVNYNQDGIIPIGQGFFVRAITSGNLTIPQSARLHNHSQGFTKTSAFRKDMVRIKAEGNNLQNETVIRYSSLALPGFDVQFDAAGFVSENPALPQIFSVSGTGKYAVNALPLADAYMHVPIYFEAGIPGQYALSMAEETFDPWVHISLEDLKTGSITNLRLDPEYEFIYSTSDDPVRFILHINGLNADINEVVDNSRVYMNNNSIYVDLDEEKSISIYSLHGQLLKQMELTRGVHVIQTDLASSFYIIRLQGKKGVTTKKIQSGY